jgi:hypothetical protein
MATVNDMGPPSLTSFWAMPIFNGANGEPFGGNFSATDDRTGVWNLYIYGRNASHSAFSMTWNAANAGQTTVAGGLVVNLWYGSLGHGTYTFDYGYLYDAIGFSKYYSSTDFVAMGFTTSVQSADSGCTAGTRRPAGRTTGCVACPPGTFAKAGSFVCTPCRPGSWTEYWGTVDCELCPPGTQSGGGGTNCAPCPKGTYAYSAGTGICHWCYPGSYANVTGSTNCHSCPGGWSSVTGATTCTKCPVGRSSYGGGSCEKCPAGYFASKAGSSQCQVCPMGSFSYTASTTCNPCADPKATTIPGYGNGPASCIRIA